MTQCCSGDEIQSMQGGYCKIWKFWWETCKRRFQCQTDGAMWHGLHTAGKAEQCIRATNHMWKSCKRNLDSCSKLVLNNHEVPEDCSDSWKCYLSSGLDYLEIMIRSWRWPGQWCYITALEFMSITESDDLGNEATYILFSALALRSDTALIGSPLKKGLTEVALVKRNV